MAKSKKPRPDAPVAVDPNSRSTVSRPAEPKPALDSPDGTSLLLIHTASKGNIVPSTIRVGTAGWSIPRNAAPRFEATGTHLQRYSRRLNCAEINSSFYRPHAASTYAKWRDSTPPAFRFSVKVPRTITHELRLEGADDLWKAFLEQTDGLADKRGPMLVQLPPSLVFDNRTVRAFFDLVRRTYRGAVACEPRHATWFVPEVESLLATYRVARVAADPLPAPSAADPAGWTNVAYFRLHGSPRMYWSRYENGFVSLVAAKMRTLGSASEVWCVFDNTASGAAAENACELSALLSHMPERSPS